MTPKTPLLLVGLLLCSSAAFAADIPDHPFIFVIGRADLAKAPDIAACSMSIHAIDPDAGRAEATVDGRLKAILATLTANGVAPDDIESSTINKRILSSEFTNEKGPAAIRGYDLARNLQFKARQLKSLPAMEAAFVAVPNVEEISCQFDRTDRKAIEADLLTKALHSAKDQADKLAEPLGRHVMTAVAISQVPFDSIPAAFGLAGGFAELERMNRMFRKSVTPENLLVPSTVQFAVSVNVLFKME